MKLARSSRHWYLPIVALFLLGSVLMGRALVFAQTGSATSSAVPSDATPTVGDQIVVTINIDVSNVDPPDEKLGSFTGSLEWDPAVLAYHSDSGILAGFTGVVNPSSSHVAFNGAKAAGATGDVTVLQITFDVVGSGSSVLDLEYSAMAAAITFEDLLPLLTVDDGHVQVSAIQYTLTMQVSPPGSGTTVPPVGEYEYDAGTEVDVTATPAAGYRFVDWTGDVADPDSASTTVTMDGDKTVRANFERLPPGGSATSSAVPSDATPDIGDQIVVTINIDVSDVDPPDEKLGSFTGSLEWDPAVLAYHSDSGILAGFTGVVNPSSGHVAFNGAKAAGATGDVTVLQITFDVVGSGGSVLDLEYSAMAAAITFENLLPLLTVNDGHVQVSAVQYTLTMQVSPSGGGTTVPPVGEHEYDAGMEVDVTATPAAGYRFVDWTGDVADPGSASTAVTMDGDKTVRANFEPIRCTLTMQVSPSGSGTTTPPVGEHEYDAGTEVDVTATPEAGYRFVNWTGNVADPGSASTTVTMDDDQTVRANFEPIRYTLTMQVSPSGGGTTVPPVGEHEYDAGTEVDVTATPAAGYRFVDWTGDVADPDSASTTVMMDGDKTVTANFTRYGRIIIEKETDPSGDTSEFDFTLMGGPSGLDQAFSLSDGEAHDSGLVLPGGGYGVTETVPTGWDLTSATCDDGSPVDNINVALGETVTCRFENTLQRGEIVIAKETDPAGGTDFDFGGDLGEFSLDDGGSKAFSDLVPGNYDVIEVVPTSWKLESVVCAGGDSTPITDGVQVRVGPGEAITCTFTNVQHRCYLLMIFKQ